VDTVEELAKRLEGRPVKDVYLSLCKIRDTKSTGANVHQIKNVVSALTFGFGTLLSRNGFSLNNFTGTFGDVREMVRGKEREEEIYRAVIKELAGLLELFPDIIL